MSAHLYTDAQIRCDAPGCPESAFGSHLDLMDSTAAYARTVLQRRGWRVAVPEPGIAGGTSGRRLDYCPRHADQPGTRI